jgi:GxxExxY protein
MARRRNRGKKQETANQGERRETKVARTKQKAASKSGVITQVRACARQVMKVLGKGHTERVYHRALITMFNKNKIQHRSEVLSPICFLGEVVGFGRCDLVVKNLIIELKANAKCPSSFSPQLRKYMSSLKTNERRKYRGVILNFNQKTGLLDVHQAPLPVVPRCSTSAKPSKKKK